MREQKRENGENIIFLFLPVKIWEHGIYKQKKFVKIKTGRIWRRKNQDAQK